MTQAVRQFDAVLFDLDGTLLDSLLDIAFAVNAAREMVGAQPIEPERLRSEIGGGLGALLSTELPTPLAARVPEMRSVFIDVYRENLLVRSRAFPGVDAVLAQLDVPYGIVTNKPKMFGEPILDALSWTPTAIVFGDSGFGRKPEPGGLWAAAHQLRAAVERTLFVGDSRVDAEAARAAGMTFRAVPWSDQRPHLSGFDKLLEMTEGGNR